VPPAALAAWSFWVAQRFRAAFASLVDAGFSP
jgi:hypothetical protein